MLIVVEQMKIKKNGDCIFEDKLEGAVSVCVMALIRKNIINYCVTPPYFYEKDVRCQVRGQNHHRSTAKACVKLDIIANFPAFAGLSTAFVVLCVLTKEVRTMARITTKEYVAAKQMKKNGDCISGNKPGGAVSVCVTGEWVKSNE